MAFNDSSVREIKRGPKSVDTAVVLYSRSSVRVPHGNLENQKIPRHRRNQIDHKPPLPSSTKVDSTDSINTCTDKVLSVVSPSM